MPAKQHSQIQPNLGENWLDWLCYVFSKQILMGSQNLAFSLMSLSNFLDIKSLFSLIFIAYYSWPRWYEEELRVDL